jgi:hypothetical protein
MAKRADITEEVQTFIVVALACYKPPSEVVRLVQEEFKVKIERQNVRHYNPLQSPDVAEKWKELFEKTRKAFIEQTSKIGAYHQSYRLAELQGLYERALAANNLPLAGNFLKQMAEECGGLYTNKRNITIDPRKALAEMLGCLPDELPTNPSIDA